MGRTLGQRSLRLGSAKSPNDAETTVLRSNSTNQGQRAASLPERVPSPGSSGTRHSDEPSIEVITTLPPVSVRLQEGDHREDPAMVVAGFGQVEFGQDAANVLLDRAADRGDRHHRWWRCSRCQAMVFGPLSSPVPAKVWRNSMVRSMVVCGRRAGLVCGRAVSVVRRRPRPRIGSGRPAADPALRHPLITGDLRLRASFDDNGGDDEASLRHSPYISPTHYADVLRHPVRIVLKHHNAGYDTSALARSHSLATSSVSRLTLRPNTIALRAGVRAPALSARSFSAAVAVV
jgi:hypothetical protein